MSRFDWLSELLAQLEDEHVLVLHGDARRLAPAHTLDLDPEDWNSVARVAARFGCRWAGIWADVIGDEFLIRACLARHGDYLVLSTRIPLRQPVLTSHTPHFPGANRLERHLQDLYGIALSDHPDSRRWTRHQAWPEGSFPLRADFPAAGRSPKRTPPDSDYAFVPVLGSGVCQIPVGPVHAGIIEPGHFRFQAVGETVLNLEERLGYVHKGIEKIAVGRDAAALARLAGRVSGDTTVGHTWAACLAMERACHIEVPSRAVYLRAVMVERERVANHLGDIAAICNDVAFSFAYYQLTRIREQWLRANQAAFGHRFMMDRIVPGGTASDLAAEFVKAMLENCQRVKSEVNSLINKFEDSETLEDRLMTTGRLTPDQARLLGAVGYVGKASGQGFDVRRDVPYPPYNNVAVRVPTYHAGDVAARAKIRADEIGISLDLISQLVTSLPAGGYMTDWPARLPQQSEGLGFVEGWRGEIISYVKLDTAGRVMRFFPRDPSWLIWPALECLIQDNIVPDFPVCNKSINGSYSGQDL